MTGESRTKSWRRDEIGDIKFGNTRDTRCVSLTIFLMRLMMKGGTITGKVYLIPLIDGLIDFFSLFSDLKE